MLTMSVLVPTADAQLSDCWDPANWTSETQNTTGSVTITASSIELINDTDFGRTNLDSLDCGATDGMVSACITVPSTVMASSRDTSKSLAHRL